MDHTIPKSGPTITNAGSEPFAHERQPSLTPATPPSQPAAQPIPQSGNPQPPRPLTSPHNQATHPATQQAQPSRPTPPHAPPTTAAPPPSASLHKPNGAPNTMGRKAAPSQPAQAQPAMGAAKKKLIKRPQLDIKFIAKVNFYIALILVICGGGFYLMNTKPRIINDLLLKIDVFGVTEVSQYEKQRIATIQKLPITYEEKQVLISHTVFLGASPDMVRLALGEPKSYQGDPQGNGKLSFIYHLPNEPTPTLLIFNGKKLTEAKKTSALDLTQ